MIIVSTFLINSSSVCVSLSLPQIFCLSTYVKVRHQRKGRQYKKETLTGEIRWTGSASFTLHFDGVRDAAVLSFLFRLRASAQRILTATAVATFPFHCSWIIKYCTLFVLSSTQSRRSLPSWLSRDGRPRPESQSLGKDDTCFELTSSILVEERVYTCCIRRHLRFQSSFCSSVCLFVFGFSSFSYRNISSLAVYILILYKLYTKWLEGADLIAPDHEPSSPICLVSQSQSPCRYGNVLSTHPPPPPIFLLLLACLTYRMISVS